MSEDSKLIALIDFIYAAVLDGDLWPTVLEELAEATGTMQAIIATMDRRTGTFASISRRAFPDLQASYKDYWAFRNPLWDNTEALPAGKVFTLDTLMPRQDFVKTPVFNEWWNTADYGFEMLGANLLVEDQMTSLICVVNARGSDPPESRQARLFEATLRHIARAARMHRQLWTLDVMHGAAPERFESLRQGAILVDAAANVLFANAPARAVLDKGNGTRSQGRLPRQRRRRGYIAAAGRLLRARGWSAARAARRRT